MSLDFSQCSILPSAARFSDELFNPYRSLPPVIIDPADTDDLIFQQFNQHQSSTFSGVSSINSFNCFHDPFDPAEFLPVDPFEMGIVSCYNYSFFEDSFDCCSQLSTGARNYPSPEDDLGQNSIHDGVFLALQYLGVKDLLTVEMVCKDLRDAVRNDPLLWRCIHIGFPLGMKVKDDDLLRLTKRAHGNVRCLSLVNCGKITDHGLTRVLESNPKLEKLSIPGCIKISVGGLIDSLKAVKSHSCLAIKHLKLGGLYSITPKHFSDLRLLLGLDKAKKHQNPQKLRFYHNECSSLACTDDRAFDIEVCPGCQRLCLVYDCPTENCQSKTPPQCRACDLCIARCVHCGRCIGEDDGFIETLFLEYLCLRCLKNDGEI